MTFKQVIDRLQKSRNRTNIEGMSRFGINTETALGISITELRSIAKKIGINHQLALELWNSKIHEARILASIIADPTKINKTIMNSWVKDINSWDLCDQCCNNLFGKTSFAVYYSYRWSQSKQTFVKRAGFVLMAVISVHFKEIHNNEIEKYLPIIIKESRDERKYVMKAINWALRQIGKRNSELNIAALEVATELSKSTMKSARWIGRDAVRELSSEKIRKSL